MKRIVFPSRYRMIRVPMLLVVLSFFTAREGFAQRSNQPPENPVQAVLWRLVRQQQAVVDGGNEVRVSPNFRPCERLYSGDIRRIIAGPSSMSDRIRWQAESLAILREAGLPLPVCFEWRATMVTTNLSRFLLRANNLYIRERDNAVRARSRGRNCHLEFMLVGHTDPQEQALDRAQERAGWIRAQSVPPTNRYRHKAHHRTPRSDEQAEFRRVTYSVLPPVPCARP